MSSPMRNLFWDACLFCRYLTGQPSEFLDDIGSYIEDSRNGLCKIYYSTITLAEVHPSHLKSKQYRSFQDFIDDLEGAFFPIDAVPSIMLDVAVIRDAKPENPNKPSSAVISTPDAIQLASCLHAQNELGITDITFHTLDWRGGTKAGEKTVPIIGLENWFQPATRVRQIAEICQLNRALPVYPQGHLRLVPTAPSDDDKAGLASNSAG